MTFKFMRPALAIALALSLSACGGKASFPISGTVNGLKYAGLTLTANGMDLAVAPNATSYTFPNSLSYGDEYEVTVKSQPAHQTCAVSVGKDSAGRLASISVPVNCALNMATIGGSITGLTSAGLVLTNGSDGGTVSPAAADTTFTFASNPVAFGVTYGVTVLTQPASDVCTVTGGAGTMGDTAIASIVVSCVPKT